MPKNTKAAGSARELKVKKKLEADGWQVRKARMSFGNADLLAYRVTNVWDEAPIKERMLIQVKANKGNPWMNFRKEERAGLLEDAMIAGAEAYLVHWPPHGEENWIHSNDWP